MAPRDDGQAAVPVAARHPPQALVGHVSRNDQQRRIRPAQPVVGVDRRDAERGRRRAAALGRPSGHLVVVVVVVVLLLLLLLVVVVVVAACAFKAAIKVYWVMRKPFLTRTSPPHTLHHTKCPHNLQSRFTGFRRSFV